MPVDAAEASGFFEDTIAADFGGGDLTDAVIEPWGAVAPRAYYTGGLRGRRPGVGRRVLRAGAGA